MTRAAPQDQAGAPAPDSLDSGQANIAAELGCLVDSVGGGAPTEYNDEVDGRPKAASVGRFETDGPTVGDDAGDLVEGDDGDVINATAGGGDVQPRSSE